MGGGLQSVRKVIKLHKAYRSPLLEEENHAILDKIHLPAIRCLPCRWMHRQIGTTGRRHQQARRNKSRDGRDAPSEQFVPTEPSVSKRTGVSDIRHDKITLVIKETSLGRESSEHMETSDDGRRVAYGEKHGWDAFAVVDGLEGKHYEFFTPRVQFSRDGQHYAYKAKRPGMAAGFVIVMDGVEGKVYGDMIGDPEFSSDGKRVAFYANDGGKVSVVADGIEGRLYDKLGDYSSFFSRDGKRLGYLARRGDKWLAVVDGIEGKKYDWDQAGFFKFSPDSKRVAYSGQREGKWTVVVDGIGGPKYEEIAHGLQFSPDSRRVIFVGKRGGKSIAVVDGKEEREYDEIKGLYGPFSRDGKRLAYSAKRGKQGRGRSGRKGGKGIRRDSRWPAIQP